MGGAWGCMGLHEVAWGLHGGCMGLHGGCMGAAWGLQSIPRHNTALLVHEQVAQRLPPAAALRRQLRLRRPAVRLARQAALVHPHASATSASSCISGTLCSALSRPLAASAAPPCSLLGGWVQLPRSGGRFMPRSAPPPSTTTQITQNTRSPRNFPFVLYLFVFSYLSHILWNLF